MGGELIIVRDGIISKNVVDILNVLLNIEDQKAKELLTIIESESKKPVPHYE